jgi:hypothetical protein
VARPGRGRGIAAIALVVVGSLSLTAGLLVGWAQRSVFDGRDFAARAVAVVDSAVVRKALAEQITDEIVRNGSSTLGSYRAELVGIVDDVMTTDGFREIFKGSIEQAHRAVFQRNGAIAVLELGETLKLVSENAKSSRSSVASSLPSAAGSLLIDVTPTVRRLELWRFANDVRWLDEALMVLTAATFVGAVALDRRRVAFLALGIGIALAGVAVAVIADLIPGIAVSTIDDPSQADAIHAAVSRFVADLQTLGLWTIPIGIVIGAAAEASNRQPTRRVDQLREWVHAHPYRELPRAGQLGVAGAVVAAGLVILGARERLVALAVLLLGVVVAYFGTVLFIRALLGPEPEPAGRRSVSRRTLLTAGAVTVTVLLVVGLVVNVTTASSSARESSELVCNGSADLCDRRLDEVAFAGSHNSMSAESDPGWLFAENVHGIPAQLEYGIRALLVKSHYGIDSGIEIAGNPLIVTDKAAEIHQDAADEASELGPDAVKTVEQIQARVGRVTGKPEVYLCHGYCELGATKFSTVLDSLRAFLNRNPNDVVIMIIGDFIRPEDTEKSFKDAGLLNRVWTYDTGRRPPTLRRMIEAKQNLLVLSEHGTGNPTWYQPAYLTPRAVVQDTPFTFASPSDFSCAPNRGRPDSPLFQINHWITTTSPPNPKQAKAVNSYASLMHWVRRCQAVRDRFPTIIGVNFYDQGGLLKVVDRLNENGEVPG